MRAFRLLALMSLVALVVAVSTIPALSQQAPGGNKIYLPLVGKNWTAPPTVASASPEAVIDAAIAKGTLDSETGLVYKVWAIYGDPRLPSQYHATVQSKFGDDTMAEARSRFSTLSKANQDIIRPYLMDPYLPGSWYMNPPAGASVSSVIAATWKYYDTANGKVRVWFTDEVPDGQNKAWALVNAIDKEIWPALVRVMGREPLVPPDPPNNYHKTSVALLKSLDAYGVTKPYAGCSESAASVEIDGSKPTGDANTFGIVQIAAHELMHATKDAFKLKSPGNSCMEYRWLSEATSNWFEDVVYPNANSERVAPGLPEFLQTPHLSIDDRTDDRHYGAYTLLYLLSHSAYFPGEDPQKRIGQIWSAAAGLDSIEAVDQVAGQTLAFTMPGTLWQKYYRTLWNRLSTDLYRQVDSLTDGATISSDDTRYATSGATPVQLNGSPMRVFELKGDLKHSSSRYYYFTFPDPTVRSVYLYDGIMSKLVKEPDWIGQPGSTGTTAYLPTGEVAVPDPNPDNPFTRGASYQVLYKVEGQDWQEAPANSAEGVSFCRDAKAERITDLVVILGNADPGRDYTLVPPGEPPVLQVSNIGCWQWTGTVSAQQQGSLAIPWTAETTVTLRRPAMPEGSLYRMAPDPGYVIQSASVKWDLSYSDGECTYSGSEVATQDTLDTGTLLTINASLTGPWHRGYYVDSPFTREFQYTAQCPSGTTTPTTGVDWFNTYNSATPDSAPIVSVDGTTLTGTATWGDATSSTTWTWALHAQQEP